MFLRASTANGSGGSDSITLTTANMPAHTHTSAAHTHTSAAHTHGVGTLATNNTGSHTHTITSIYVDNVLLDQTPASKYHARYTGSKTDATGSLTSMSTASSAGGHSHTVSGSTASTMPGNTGSTTPGNTGSAGSGTAFDNRPKYIDVYTWKRTA